MVSLQSSVTTTNNSRSIKVKVIRVLLQAYLFCGLLTFAPVLFSVLFSLRLCHKMERGSHTLSRLLTYLCALSGFYPQFLACRFFFLKITIATKILWWSPLFLSIFRTVMTGLGFWGGDWEKNKEKCRKVNLIEPVVEGVTQLFFQSIILYIIHGPGTSKIHCKYLTKKLNCDRKRVFYAPTEL